MIYLKIVFGLMAYATYFVVVVGIALGYKGAVKQPFWLKILTIPTYPILWTADLLLWLVQHLERAK